MADLLPSTGKLLQFAAPRVVSGISPGLMIEELIANNLQLLSILGRVRELYSHAPDDDQMPGDTSIVHDLQAAYNEATRLHDILDHNTLGIRI